MKCPNCGFEESPCWHYPSYHGVEMPYARIQELREFEPELAAAVEAGIAIRPKVLEYVDKNYAYKYSVSSGYVRRRELALYKAFKWDNCPMEKRKPFVPGKQAPMKEFLLTINQENAGAKS